MDLNKKEVNNNVLSACLRLLCELRIYENRNHPYAIPYANYVLSWCTAIPINTVIIGQNPYPDDIYPDIGAAFSYDPSKCRHPTKTVRNMAYDVSNFDGTDVNMAAECFANSWSMIEDGIIFINETVFSSISETKSNTRGIKEMEAQVRALQIIFSESFNAGQSEFICIGMGTKAEQMTSIIRPWNPKDLFQIKIITCNNPAARNIGDGLSQDITLGKASVSKVLSNIVHRYSVMPSRPSAAEKRRAQHKDVLTKAATNVETTANIYSRELQSLETRLKGGTDGDAPVASINDVVESLGSLRKSIDNHRNAVVSHSVTLCMVIEAISKDMDKGDSNTTVAPVIRLDTTEVTAPKPGRRVVKRTPSVTPDPSSSMHSIEEKSEPPSAVSPLNKAPDVFPDSTETEIKPPSVSRGRRVVRRRPSTYAHSEAPTEYTTEIKSSDGPKDISVIESISLKSFATWASENKDDKTLYQILNSAAVDKLISNPLTSKVVEYIRERKMEDPGYDAYDELLRDDSRSYGWAISNIHV